MDITKDIIQLAAIIVALSIGLNSLFLVINDEYKNERLSNFNKTF